MDERRNRSGGRPRPATPAEARPTKPQRHFLERGLMEAGGKLPLFDRGHRPVPRKTIEACLAHGWAEPWIANPIKPDWLVCKLTPKGYRSLGAEPKSGATVPIRRSR